jgi:hemerythrin superfamily protein
LGEREDRRGRAGRPAERVVDARDRRLQGAYVNALELIKTDHERLKKLFDDALANDEPAAREAVLHAIRSELMAHERMEEDIFYPALRSVNQKAREIVMEGFEEHHIIDIILDELMGVPEDAEVWRAKLKVLRENLDHHMEEEEGEMFKRARQALSTEALDELGDKMEQAKKAASA